MYNVVGSETAYDPVCPSVCLSVISSKKGEKFHFDAPMWLKLKDIFIIFFLNCFLALIKHRFHQKI